MEASRPAMDYLFLSGVLALDLVNTEVVVRGKRYDLFACPEDVAVWWQQARTHYPEAEQVRANTEIFIWSAQLLERIKLVRAAIRTLCTNLVERQSWDVEALTTLNTILAMGYPALETASGPAGNPSLLLCWNQADSACCSGTEYLGHGFLGEARLCAWRTLSRQ